MPILSVHHSDEPEPVSLAYDVYNLGTPGAAAAAAAAGAGGVVDAAAASASARLSDAMA